MSTILISTRKGLFEAQASGGAYSVTRGHFIGDNVSVAMADPRGGWYAALDHGHFGGKLHRSDDRGATWTEIRRRATCSRAAIAARAGTWSPTTCRRFTP